MKNILIMKFPYSSLYGGGERHTILLVEGLQQKGFDFFLFSSCRVLLREFRKRKWPAARAWAGLEPVSVGALLLWPLTAVPVFFYLSIALLYYRLFKRTSILYCLSLTEKLLATIPARCLGMRVVWVEHVTFERWLTANPLKLLYRLFSRFVTIVAVSHEVKRQMVDHLKISAQRIVVIYTGIELSRFVMKQERWEKTARYNIGCVARLEKEKGIEFLIHAIKIIREFVPFVRLIVVGEGSEKKKLVWLTERLELKEVIQWVGYQREVNKWYSFFDAYVLPSVTRESFGITIVEAMACGVPVVASRLGGIPEIIDDKKTGLLAKPGDSQDLADKLIFIYNNRAVALEMVRSARQKVEQQFSQERMLRDYYLLFRK